MEKKNLSRRNFIKNGTVGIAAAALMPGILRVEKARAKEAPEDKMFCYQCEQTKGGKGCTRIGVCGKKPGVALRGRRTANTGNAQGLGTQCKPFARSRTDWRSL